MAQVYTKTYSLPEPCKREILRYAGIRDPLRTSDELIALFDEAVAIATPYIEPRICFCELDVDECDFLGSLDIKKNLRESQRVIIFAATLGLGIDRLIARYGVLSPATALLIDAIGSERIEALCDEFCADIKTQKAQLGFSIRPRFSAGYGDLPIEYQRTVFALLDPPARIGVTLNDSYLMTPTKSVTAIIGVEKIKEF